MLPLSFFFSLSLYFIILGLLDCADYRWQVSLHSSYVPLRQWRDGITDATDAVITQMRAMLTRIPLTII